MIKFLFLNKAFKTSMHDHFLKKSLVSSAFILMLISIFMLIINSGQGFDITDESYYLLLARNPKDQLIGLTYFGYVTTFLYQIAGQNIALFRLLGIFILFSCSLIFSIAFFNYWNRKSTQKLSKESTIYLIVILTLSVATYYFQWWLITPSYNWLTLIGLLLTASALFLVVSLKENSIGKKFICSALILGFAGVLTFLGKPTTALFLSILCLLWTFWHRHDFKALIFLGLSGLTAFLLMTLYVYINFHGYPLFYNNIKESSSLINTLLGESSSFYTIIERTVFQLDHFYSALVKTGIFKFNMAIFILGFISIALKKWRLLKYSIYTMFFLTNLFWLGLLLQVHKIFFLSPDFENQIGQISPSSVLLSISLFSFLTLILTYFLQYKENKAPTLKTMLFVNCLSLFLAIAYAFGTGNDVVHQMSGAAIFLILTIVINYQWINQSLQAPFFLYMTIFMISCSAFAFFMHSYNQPYRLIGSIQNQKYPVRLMAAQGQLKVDKATADYINQIQRTALQQGWQPNNTVIDLTGATPGISLILNAHFIYTAWFLGGYVGSNQYVKSIFDKTPEPLLKKAWLLTAANGSQKIDEQLLLNYGIHYPSDYLKIGVFKTGHRNEIQALWKPIDES